MREFMAHFVFGTTLAVVLSVPFVAISYNAASAQAGNLLASTVTLRQAAGLPKAVRGLLQTGCWTVGPVKRCGYQQQ
jgi:hypothetical protein